MSRSQYNTQGTQGDTPHSYSRIIKSIFKMEEKIPSVRDAVNAELIGHVRVCDTNVFLDRILPLPNGVKPESMLVVLKKQRNYTQSKRWSAFPREDSEPQAAESFFYGPFILAANAILGVVSDEKKNRLGGKWLDRHDEAPQSSEDSAKARPDCLFVARPPFVMKLEKEVRELEGRMKLRDSTLKERTARLVRYTTRSTLQLLINVLGTTAERLVASDPYTSGNQEEQRCDIVQTGYGSSLHLPSSRSARTVGSSLRHRPSTMRRRAHGIVKR